MAITFTLNGTTTLDESAGVQNLTATPSPAGDADDNDASLSRLQTQSEFYNRLFGTGTGQLALPTTFPAGGRIAESPDNFIQISAAGTVGNVSFTDSTGAALNGADSGLDATADGGNILLFTDPTNDNIVLGKVGDASGRIAFSAYIQEIYNSNNVLIGAKIWMVTFEAVKQLDTSSYDESVSILANRLFVSVSENLSFDLNTLASGQNQWNAFGDQSNQIIVSADTSGQTVNTSKGGGSTTIGNTNQLLDGVDPAKDANGEAMVFTFVKNSPGLLTADKGNFSNISYQSLLAAKSAEWSISQTQNGAAFAEATMVALSTAQETGSAYFPGLSNDTIVAIHSVTITNGSGQTLLTAVDDGNTGNDSVSRTIGKGGNANTFALSVTFNIDGSATVKGLEAKDTISYTTVSDHNRVRIQNTGIDATSLDWDIGGFKLLQVGSAHQDVGPALSIEDAGPTITASATGAVPLTVDESVLATNATGSFAAQFTKDFGTDGAAGTDSVTYALSTPGGASGLTDTATGQSVVLSLNASGQVVGKTAVSDDTVFVVSVDASGNVTLDQQRAIVHANPNDPDESRSMTTTNLVVLTGTATDKDGDHASAPLDLTPLLVFKDDGPSITATLTGAPTLTVDDTILVTDPTGSFAAQFTPNYGADGQGATPVSYALSTPGGASGLTDTATGEAVVLSAVGGQILGKTATTGLTVFVVSVNASGQVTLDQQRAVVHPDATNPDDSKTLSAANLVVLTATATDKDGDSGSGSLNIGQLLVFKDDGPAITVDDITNATYALGGSSKWSEAPGADGFKSLNITLNDYTIDSHAAVTVNNGSLGTVTTTNTDGNYVFNGSITADFTDDGIANNQTVNFKLTFDPDDGTPADGGTYFIEATSPPSSTTTISSANGSLDAGGPDPVRTLTIGTRAIVFSAVKALASVSDIEANLDKTEAQIQTNPLPTYLSPSQMNVSTAGIGLGNNNFDGNALANVDGQTTQGGAFDESFVIDPTNFLVSGMKVFIDNSVGGYTPTTEGIFYRIYYDDGTVSSTTKVNATDLTPAAGGQVSFQITSAHNANDIDAVQLFMGSGTVKVPVIEFNISQTNAAQSLAMNFTATLSDGDSDTHQDTFKVAIA